jgi:putative membrane protein
MLAIGLAAAFAFATPAAFAQMQPQSGGAGPQTQAKPGAATKMNKADERFLTEAMQGDLAEVKMGELAQQKGQSDRVKAYGETLVKDHGDHSKKLQQLGQQMNMTLPGDPSSKQKSDYDRLSKMSGAQFDRDFAKLMVEGHRQMIAKYQPETKKSGPIGDMAKETMPTLQHHLQMAQELSRPAPTTGSGNGMNRGAGGSSGSGMGGNTNGGMRR